MKRSLRTQMLVQYVAIVLVCMIVIPTAISWMLDRRFRSFATEKLAEDRQEIASAIGGSYEAVGGWNEVIAGDVRGDFMRWPIVRIALFDENGELVREFCRSRGRGTMMKSLDDERSFFKKHGMDGDFVTLVSDVKANGRTVGSLRFFCLPFSESREGHFLRSFNRNMYYAVGFMVLIAMVIAFFMADRISRPVLMAAKRAYLISRGKYRMDDDVSSDITEIQTLIDSMNRLGLGLEEQEELRKRLMSDIAHELRNPVTVVKSHLEAFEDGVWQPTTERLRLTVSEVDRLSVLISEVEKLTTLENAGRGLALSTTNFSELLEKTAMTFDPLCANKSVTLERDIEPDVNAAADVPKFRQVIENLLSNALRYTDSGGTIKLSLRRRKDAIVISVADSGIGISEKDLPYIFERFYRTDKSRARASGGLGIGLAIVKAIAEAHGGTIKAESKEGHGSTFTVTLPVSLLTEE